MVRLKAKNNLRVYWQAFISIPYGAIKSNYINKIPDPIQDISIPYGAIKSITEW